MSVELFLVVRLVMERTATIATLEARAARLRVRSTAQGNAFADEDRSAARQLQLAADDIRAGFHWEDGQ